MYTFGEELVLSGGFLLLCAGTKSYCDSSSLVGNLGVNYRHTNVSSLINNNLLLTLNVFTTNQESFSNRAEPTSSPLPDDKEFFAPFNDHLHSKVKEVFESLRKSKLKDIDPETY